MQMLSSNEKTPYGFLLKNTISADYDYKFVIFNSQNIVSSLKIHSQFIVGSFAK